MTENINARSKNQDTRLQKPRHASIDKRERQGKRYKEIGDRDSTSLEVHKHCIRQTMAQHKVLAPQQSAETVTKVTAHLFYTNRPTINVLKFNSMKSTFIKLEGISLFKYWYKNCTTNWDKSREFIVLSISCTG